MLDLIKPRLQAHVQHVQKNGEHCSTEETTKQALILPLLDILGFSPFDPTRVKAEYAADFPGAKSGERVDYALFSHNTVVMFVEAKPYLAKLDNHCPQLSRYFNATPAVAVAAITNGREWRFFTDLAHKNIMDEKPFLTVHLDAYSEDIAEKLARFHHDQFQPEALRALAEENLLVRDFKAAITTMLRECDADLVKYVAGRAQLQRNMTAKVIEQLQPVVRQAIVQAISGMVASTFDDKPVAMAAVPTVTATASAVAPHESADVVDPQNSKIITTLQERQLIEFCRDLLPGEDLHGKDTESYFSVLFEGKNNRWMLRYWGDKKRPTMQIGIELTDAHKAEIARARLELTSADHIYLDRPENILRIAGLLGDALAYCKNDDNFRRKTDGLS